MDDENTPNESGELIETNEFASMNEETKTTSVNEESEITGANEEVLGEPSTSEVLGEPSTSEEESSESVSEKEVEEIINRWGGYDDEESYLQSLLYTERSDFTIGKRWMKEGEVIIGKNGSWDRSVAMNNSHSVNLSNERMFWEREEERWKEIEQ
jgi:hypothetical protein